MTMTQNTKPPARPRLVEHTFSNAAPKRPTKSATIAFQKERIDRLDVLISNLRKESLRYFEALTSIVEIATEGNRFGRRKETLEYVISRAEVGMGIPKHTTAGRCGI
jgi:hypothetical protein